MVEFKAIYASQAEKYDRLVAHEDCKGNILPALTQIRQLVGMDVIELGAGTGRLTSLLAPLVNSIVAFDNSAHMLAVAKSRLAAEGWQNWALAVADNRRLPVATATADVAIAGWSLGHLVGWYPQTWRDEVGLALAEMKRICRSGGAVILLETQGTGRDTPQPPASWLADFYRWLETEHGFNTTWIRTDYRFASVEQAADLTRFFFGNELADEIIRHRMTVLPECTGIWWLAV
ncbi:MAG TPA: class I SAM-dependent methyltransferase [Anaerolineae bacterium]